MSADRQAATVGPNISDFLDPYVCSCFPTAYHSALCRKLKWSTLSIAIALIILIVYASSGLYTLIDVTTLMAIEPADVSNETTIFWSMLSSSEVITLSWMSLSVYFFVVLLIIILLCGIQWSKPWLLFLWSILMIVMLLADGIVTVLALREYQQRAHRPTRQVQILFLLMIIRLIASLCGIFITVFHFRRLNKTLSEYTDRQRMLFRYNADSASPSYNSSWAHADGLLNASKDESIDLREPEVPLQMTLPRAQLATIQRRPMSSMFHSRQFGQPAFDDYHGPLADRYPHAKLTEIHS